jgi:hypothetical protein
MTCSDRCLKSHRQEQFKQKLLAALKWPKHIYLVQKKYIDHAWET